MQIFVKNKIQILTSDPENYCMVDLQSLFIIFISLFLGLGTMTWSPLACGILTGKYEDGIPCHSRAALKVNTTQRLKLFYFFCRSCPLPNQEKFIISQILIGTTLSDYFILFVGFQHCLWLKEKILSEDGKRQQQKLRELAKIASKLKCSLAQLAIGNYNNLLINIPFSPQTSDMGYNVVNML